MVTGLPYGRVLLVGVPDAVRLSERAPPPSVIRLLEAPGVLPAATLSVAPLATVVPPV